MKLMLLFIGLLFGINFVLAETTFFEGNYNEDFIMVGENNVDSSSVYCGNAICDEGESCSSCKVDCGVCVGGSSGGGIVPDKGEDSIPIGKTGNEIFIKEKDDSKMDSSYKSFITSGAIFNLNKKDPLAFKIISGIIALSILFVLFILIKKIGNKK